MDLVDTHVHLDDEAFAADRPTVIERAVATGVATMVAIGTSVESSRRVLALSEQFPQVRAALGIHPHEAGRVAADAVEMLAALVGHSSVVAVGETGLDFFRDYAPRPAQAGLFRAHLTLARKVGLPVVIHCRDAYPEVLAILDEFLEVTAIFHAFSGSREVAADCVRRGHYLAFGGPLTFRHTHQVEAARAVPLDRVLLETDAPSLAPRPFRGRRNEPAHLRLIAERLAEVRGLSLDEVAAATTDNARRVLRLERVGVGR